MKNFTYDLTTTVFLFLTAIIWGFAFLFQKTAMESLGPYYFTGFRFLLGTLVLFPFTIYNRFLPTRKIKWIANSPFNTLNVCWNLSGIWKTILQQIGLEL